MAWPRTLFACLFSAAILFAATTPSAYASTRTRMVKTINDARDRAQVRGVRHSARLSARAVAWARYLIRTGRMAHSSAARGEVIEWHAGTRPRIRHAVGAWLRSRSHRRVILSPRYRRAGAGRAVGYMNGRQVTVWVVRFAAG